MSEQVGFNVQLATTGWISQSLQTEMSKAKYGIALGITQNLHNR